jgi:sulfur-oxidizing protein SoxX
VENIMNKISYLLFVIPLFNISYADSSDSIASAETYCQWQVTNYAIEQPLCGYTGNAERGKAIASDGSKGNCLACHQLPIEGIEAYGTIGPPLAGIGSRQSEGFIRLRVVDTRNINPMSIMPGFYRDPKLINRPGKPYIGRTFLSAQQVEDVIAYLVTLK